LVAHVGQKGMNAAYSNIAFIRSSHSLCRINTDWTFHCQTQVTTEETSTSPVRYNHALRN